MKVYKFGGASVRSDDGVRNLKYIVEDEKELFIVVSAMGKTTNALEEVVEHFMAGNKNAAMARFEATVDYHNSIIADLFEGAGVPLSVEKLYNDARYLLDKGTPTEEAFEQWYDAIVSYGELLSTTIISEYLNVAGVANKWVDMRRCFITDDRFKYANVNIEASTAFLSGEVERSPVKVFVGQGFIGATITGKTTTLGREGSDYSAAVVASILDAESLSIWKDVEGVLNGDPKIFADSKFIPELTYHDAIELAFSGAQIIHPKTIKPLQNKGIPLYVRPFGDKWASGSVIKSEIASPIDVPILILKRGQVLLTIRPRDYSFVLEERLGDIFAILAEFNVKVNLVQTSAVDMSLVIDTPRRVDELITTLQDSGFKVLHNKGMELLTIRGYTAPLLEKYASREDENVYVVQRTRRIVRIVRKGIV
jgi:aspartate kinase